jgi:hypothetical protein
MTVEEVRVPTLDPATARWLGYGLMVAGSVLPVVSLLARPDLTNEAVTLGAVVVPAALLALVVHAPAAFEVKARRSPARVINFLLILPSASLMVAAVTTPLLVPQVGFLTAAAGAAIGLLIGLWAPRHGASANPVILLLFFALFGGGYGAGAPFLINLRFDRSAGQVYQAPVEARQVIYGRGGPGYSLRLGAWGPVTAARTVGVPRAVYDAMNPGDTACVTLHPGALGMAWYHIARC